MSCIQNINRFLIPNDVIVTLSEIYQFIGKNDEFIELVGNDKERVIGQTVERDSYFLSKILGYDISDMRTRLIITKDSNPRNKDETTLSNLKDMLLNIQKRPMQFNLKSNDILNVTNLVFAHYNTAIKFDYVPSEKKSLLQSQNMKSKRLIIDEINTEVELICKNKSYEKITLFLHYFIDFYNIKPLSSQNEVANWLFLYLLLIKCNITAFRYVSFFEIIFEDYKNFQTELLNSSFNWQEGFSQSTGFIRYMVNLILNGYKKADEIIRNYKFDKDLNKIENIKNTIFNMTEIFTKEEIRHIHPYVSESTINRALLSLRDDGFISPLGKGRSAKWIRKSRGYRND